MEHSRAVTTMPSLRRLRIRLVRARHPLGHARADTAMAVALVAIGMLVEPVSFMVRATSVCQPMG